ncbi:hypothetical protein [Chitinimonas naiadis]
MRLPSLLLLISSLPLFAATPAEPDAFEPGAVAGARAGWRPDISQREAVRLFYQVRYKASPASGYWRGSLADCQPGELLPSHRNAMLDRINWFRAMAGVPADLEEDLATSRKMQAAALAVAANGRIVHQIDGNWRC